MTEHQQPDEATNRAAALIAQALSELQQAAASRDGALRQELDASRSTIQELAARIEGQLVQEQEQRLVMAGQLNLLAGSLDRLVGHLQSLSQLMADILERLVEPATTTTTARPQPAAEPAFQPGGEGVSLVLNAVPGFQALMDIQKGLVALAQVTSASVERFQEGDSRLLLLLSAPISANELVTALRQASNLNVVVEESRPELLRLQVKLLPAG